MNVLLLVVDSLRACSLQERTEAGPRTPFLDELSGDAWCFRRAYATECWTLPTHASMFTGLLPSQHGAHFQTMAYDGTAPTIAEVLGAAGYFTEIITRNFVFDGTIPGITRGFQHYTRPLSQRGLNLFGLLLAVAKPRFRRHVRTTGFFHPFHRDNRAFLQTFARSLLPADERALDYVLHRAAQLRREGRRYFLFCNLYDVHAPYAPSTHSIIRSFRSISGWRENLMFPRTMAGLGSHAYLKPGFRLSDAGRRMLRARYHRAIELMDAKLAAFWRGARAARLFEDTLVILTSDHGEAFGEHGLYLHDASVYNTHLHVPLWVRHPGRAPEIIDDTVSTRDLFGLISSTAGGDRCDGTILDSSYRRAHPVAFAEHFYYPRCPTMDPKYRTNQAAVIVDGLKLIARHQRVTACGLANDPGEMEPNELDAAQLDAALRHAGAPQGIAAEAKEHLRRFGDA